ncbi:MAG: hypothetical protein Q8S51_06340, partial [Rhodoferax sp.]|uniref:hypothetical protein n=1 Tax=Rhodoferax sp. TaxID=50421 RepID=UPI002732EEDE
MSWLKDAFSQALISGQSVRATSAVNEASLDACGDRFAAFANHHEYPLSGSAAVQRLYVAGHPAPIKFPFSQPIPPVLGCMLRQPLIAKPRNWLALFT